MPVWDPDGQRLIFQSRRDGGGNLYWQQSDGTGAAQPLTTGIESFVPTEWSVWQPDSRVVAIRVVEVPMMASSLPTNRLR